MARDQNRSTGYSMLGIPDGFDGVAAVAFAGPIASPAAEPTGRDITTELGLPAVRAGDLRPLSESERQAYDRREEAEAEALFAQTMREETPPWAATRWLRGAAKMYFAAGLAFAALLALFAYAQTLQILAHLSTQPDWIRYSGYGVLALVGAALAFAAGRFAWTYGRYRRLEQVSIGELAALAERRELRELSRRKTAAAVERLQGYLRGFDLDGRPTQQLLDRCGVDVRKLRIAREWLLDDDNYASADAWIAEFRQRFQQPLDAAASSRLNAHFLRVTLGTAASPNGLVDSSIVLTSCFAFLADACQLYNLRLGTIATGKLLAWSFANSYVAGQIDDLSDRLADIDFSGAAEEATSAIMQVLRPFVAKTAEGAANGLLLRRLGKQAIRLLQPVAA